MTLSESASVPGTYNEVVRGTRIGLSSRKGQLDALLSINGHIAGALCSSRGRNKLTIDTRRDTSTYAFKTFSEFSLRSTKLRE